jgi:DNA/RNA-binding domain of Phe-tRNA-synthetase-like protein
MVDPIPVSVDAEIAARFPDFRVLVILVRDLANGPSDDRSRRLLRSAEHAARAAFGDRPASSHPHVQAWREAYGTLGSKPSRYFSSVEGLLRRVLRGDEVPGVNRAVDAYNAVSVEHVLPAGGEDWDRVAPPLRLGLARGGEAFSGIDGQSEPVDAGEAVWRDADGITCRRWNWRQGTRTRLTENSTAACFVLERLAPFPLADLHAAGDALEHALRALSPACRVTRSALPGQYS